MIAYKLIVESIFAYFFSWIQLVQVNYVANYLPYAFHVNIVDVIYQIIWALSQVSICSPPLPQFCSHFHERCAQC